MGVKKKVVVAMSGGVDSSVAAALLQRQGYECVGVFMRLGNDPAEEGGSGGMEVCSLERTPPEGGTTNPPKGGTPNVGGTTSLSLPVAQQSHKQGCCSTSDAADARFVAGLLDMPFYALNFQHDFGGIIDYFVREYNAGRTPNPCVRCNEYLKFGKLSRYAHAIGADYVATGHYARIVQADGETHLLRGRDHKKDQSYVLFGVPREELGRMLLPIGDLKKTQVRQIAEELKLPVFNKPDSQEICFVPDNDYARLVRAKTPEKMGRGEFVDAAGKVLGHHAGHQHFTIGQRKGIGIAGPSPIYVAAIDPASNRVTLAGKEALLHRKLTAREVNWLRDEGASASRRCAGKGADGDIGGTPMLRGPQEPVRVLAKVRYNSPPVPAMAVMTGPDELTVRFDEPVLAITAGQAVVCYEGERLIGGAWIDGVSE